LAEKLGGRKSINSSPLDPPPNKRNFNLGVADKPNVLAPEDEAKTISTK